MGFLSGPEGGFEEKEVEAAISEGAKPITLGKRILRTETAGLAILSVLMFQLEKLVKQETIKIKEAVYGSIF